LRGKKPLNDFWHKTPYQVCPDLAPYKQGYNYGVILGTEHFVVDVDPRNFPPGRNSLAELAERIGVDLFAAAQPVVQTAGGGWHLYFKKPAAVKTRNHLAEFPGIEFKSLGRQLVGPGCRHANGGYYQWYRPLGAEIPLAPAALLQLVVRTGPSVEGTAIDTSAQAEGRYREWLERAQPATEGRNGDNATFAAAAKGRDYGLAPRQVLEVLIEPDGWNGRCSPPWAVEELAIKVENAFAYAQNPQGSLSPLASFKDASEFVQQLTQTPEDATAIITDNRWKHSLEMTAKGVPVKDSFQNTYLLFKYHKDFREVFYYDDFRGAVMLRHPLPGSTQQGQSFPRQLNGTDIPLIRTWLNGLIHVFGHVLDARPSTITCAIEAVAQENRRHPVREYLTVLAAAWDGKYRLAGWMSTYLGAENTEYTQSVALITLLAAVKRVFEPGCKFDAMPVLEGPQGVGKSTAIRILAHDWFTDNLTSVTDKRLLVEETQGSWLVEVSELAAFHKAQVEHLKKALSSQEERVRMAYAAAPVTVPRQFIFVGTTNRDDYLADETGNRRFWPVRCGRIDLEALQRDREQLWAEAMAAYRAGVPLVMPEHLREVAAEQQGQRFVDEEADSWAARLQGVLNVMPPGTFLQAGALLQMALEIPEREMTRKDFQRLKRAMQQIGIEQVLQKREGRVRRGYVIHAKDYYEAA
jgi:predicted P-loop ATPase